MADVEEEDALPPNWVKRCSRRREAQVYYFNTSTGESSWTRPSKFESSGGEGGRQEPQASDKRSSSDSDSEKLFRGAAKKLIQSIERPCREAQARQVGEDINERWSSNIERKQCSNLQKDGHTKCVYAGNLQSILNDGKIEKEDSNSKSLESKIPEGCKKLVARHRCSASSPVYTEEQRKVEPETHEELARRRWLPSLAVSKEKKSEGMPESCQKLVTETCSVSPSFHSEETSEAGPELRKKLVAKRRCITSPVCTEEQSETKGKHAHSLSSNNTCNMHSDNLSDKKVLHEDTQIEFRKKLFARRRGPPKPSICSESSKWEKNNVSSDIGKKTSSEDHVEEVVRKDVHTQLAAVSNQAEQRDSKHGEQKDGNQVEQKKSEEQQLTSTDVKDKNVGAETDKVESKEKCKPVSEKKFREEEYKGKIITIGKITKPSKSPRISFRIDKKAALLSRLSPVFKEKEIEETKPVFRIPKKRFLPLDKLKDKDETFSERKAQIIGKALAALTQEEYKELIGSERQKSSVTEAEKLDSLYDINEYVKEKETGPALQKREAITQEKSVRVETSESKDFTDYHGKELTESKKGISDSEEKNIFKKARHQAEEKERRSHSSKSSSHESSRSKTSRSKSSRSRSSRRRSSHRRSSPERGSSSKKYDVKTSRHKEERDYSPPMELMSQAPEVMCLQSPTEELQFGQGVFSSHRYENESFTEAMEVETTEIISEISSFRDTAPVLDEKFEHWNPEAAKTLEKSNEVVSSLTLRTEGLKPISFVVDTNILIEDLTYVKKMCQFSIHGRELIIVVPYGAIQELDGLKQSNRVGPQSQKAIKWCHERFLAKDRRVLGQTFVQYKQAAQLFEGQSGDDRIRDCALQLKQMGVDVVLLSNDINLLNKALLAGLDVSNLDSLKEKINDAIKSSTTGEVDKPSKYSKLTTDTGDPEEKPVHSLAMNVRARDKEEMKNADIVDKIKVMLKGTLGKILEYYMKEMFENLWLQIVVVKPPWTLEDLFLCWEKHWLAVFIDPFPKKVNTWVKEAAVLCKKTKLTTSEVQDLLTVVENLYKVFRETCESLVVEPPSDFNTSHLNSNSSESSVLPAPSNILSEEQSKKSSKSLLSDGKELNTPQTVVTEIPQPLSVPSPSTTGTEHGTLNLQEMIKNVGLCMEQYLTTLVDSVAKSTSMPSQEPPSSFTLTSLQNLGQSVKTFGSVIVECLQEGSDEVIMKLGTFLTEFWTHANLPCPSLSFTSTDIREFLSAPNGRNYLQEVTKELERFYHVLESTFQRVTQGGQ